jgi:hypothetical protein
VAVEKGTKAVILLNLSVFGERTFNNLQTKFLAKVPRKEFFNTHRDYTALTRRPSWKRDFSPELLRGLGLQVGASTTCEPI